MAGGEGAPFHEAEKTVLNLLAPPVWVRAAGGAELFCDDAAECSRGPRILQGVTEPLSPPAASVCVCGGARPP